MTTKNEFQAVYFHKVGTPQSDDELVYEDKEHPQRFQNVGVTEDQRFAVLSFRNAAKAKRERALLPRPVQRRKDILANRRGDWRRQLSAWLTK